MGIAALGRQATHPQPVGLGLLYPVTIWTARARLRALLRFGKPQIFNTDQGCCAGTRRAPRCGAICCQCRAGYYAWSRCGKQEALQPCGKRFTCAGVW
jgi:hypothetical protein